MEKITGDRSWREMKKQDRWEESSREGWREGDRCREKNRDRKRKIADR